MHTARLQAWPPQFIFLDINLRFLEKCPAEEGTGAPNLEEGTYQETGTQKEDVYRRRSLNTQGGGPEELDSDAAP